MKEKHSWTEPYYGVSHLNFWPDNRTWQVTVSDYGGFADGVILALKSDTVFSQPVFKITGGDLELIKKELVKKAKELGII